MKTDPNSPRAQEEPAPPTPQASKPAGSFGLLIPKIQQAIAAQKYYTPTPIQEQSIPHILEGRDILGSAQTGTGKTAAFTLPLLHKLTENEQRPGKGTPRALVLAPTRELAAQIEQSIKTYGSNLRLRHSVIYGGVKQFPQVKALKQGVDILVATPGRLLDLMEQGYLRLDKIETFILDEVDRMLDMGFIPDIKRILSKVPKNRQTLFYSATMGPKIESLARSMTQDPIRITIEPDTTSVELITQRALFISREDKNDLLLDLVKQPEVGKAIIFTQMKHVANRVVEKLRNADIAATAIHGNKTQANRMKSLDGFKKGRFRVLVATDVAARGIDVDDITHVINYDLPVEAETYIHRIGRTARAGSSGTALALCTTEDKNYLHDIQKHIGKDIPPDFEHDYHNEQAYKRITSPPNQKNKKPNRNQRGSRRQKGGFKQGDNNKQVRNKNNNRSSGPRRRDQNRNSNRKQPA